MIKYFILLKKMVVMVFFVGVVFSIVFVQVVFYLIKQIELVVFYVAGGGMDLVVCVFVDVVKNYLFVSIGVINKFGGGGVIGLSEIVVVCFGGYKIGLGMVELIIFFSFGMVCFKISDFKFIVCLNVDLVVIIVCFDVLWNSYEEFMIYVKVNFGKVCIGNLGIGVIWYLVVVVLEDKMGVKFFYVLYDGVVFVIIGLLGGYIEVVFVSLGEVINYVKGGKLKILVVMVDE